MRTRPRATGPPATLKAATVRVGLAALILAAAASSAEMAQAQEPAPETKTLEVTSTSPEAVELFWAGLDDALNVTPLRMSERMQEALALDPEFGLARVVNARYTLDMPRDERQAEIERGLASLVASGASTGEFLMVLAWRDLMRGDVVTSRKLFATVRDLYPDDPMPSHLYTLQTQRAEGINQEIVEFKALTDAFPDFAPAYNILGFRLWQTGDRAGGVEAIAKYLELLPDHPNANDSYAEIMQWSGRYEEAIEYYNRANELYPIWAWSAGLAEVNQLMGDGERAREHIAVAIETAPTDGQRISYQLAMGNSFLLDGDTQAALDEYEASALEAEAAEMKGMAAWSYVSLAVADALFDEGSSVESALQKAEEAVGTEVWFYRAGSAVAWAAAGDAERAHAAVQNLGEDQADVLHVSNALLFMNQNEALKAEQELAMADPDNELARALLGTCYKETGRLAEAHALRDDVLAGRDMNLADVTTAAARTLAARI